MPWFLKMHKKYIFFYQVLVILTLSLYVTAINLGTNKDFVGDDAGLKYYNSNLLQEQTFFMWDELTFPGIPNTVSPFGLVYSTVVLAFFKLGFTSIAVERLLFFLFFIISGVGFLLLVKEFHYGEREDKWIQVMLTLVAVHYIFNNFTVIFTSFPQHNYHLSYMFFPWIFYLYKRNFEEKTNFSKIAALSIALLMYFGGNISNTLSGLFIIFSYAIVFRKNITIKFKYVLLLAGEVLLLTAYIYLPILSSARTSLFTYVDADTNIDSLGFNSTDTSFFNVVRFSGFHSLKSLDFANYFLGNPLFILASIYLLFLLIAYLRKNKITGTEKFFLVMFLLSVVLAKGAHPPLKSVFIFLFENIPFLQMFRAVYYKFVPYIIVSLLLLASYIFVSYKGKSKAFKVTTTVIYLTVIVVTSWPLVRGISVRSFHLVSIPESYLRLYTYLKENVGRQPILSLPQTSDPILSWGLNNNYTSYSIQLSLLTGQPVWNWAFFNSEVKSFLEQTYSPESIISLMKLYGVKYVLLQKDIPEDYYFNKEVRGRPMGQTNFLKYETAFNNSNSFRELVNDDYFKLYVLTAPQDNFTIGAPNELYLAEDINLQKMLDNIGSDQNIVFINTSKVSEGDFAILNNYEATSDCHDYSLSYHKNNPSSYRLQVKSRCRYVPILFTQSYDPGWKLRNNSPNRNVALHLVANSFANFWLLDINSYCETTPCALDGEGRLYAELDITFEPQKYFDIGILISSVSLGVFVLTGLLIKYVKPNN